MDFRDLEARFAQLESAGSALDEFRVLPLRPDSGPRVQVALDPSGRRHLLFKIPSEDSVLTDAQSAGVQIRRRVLLDNGESTAFVDLACVDPNLAHVFTVLAVEVVSETLDADTTPDQAGRLVLERWRRLLRRAPAGSLTASERIGLFGELIFLTDIAARDPAAVTLWAGPTGGRHDFIGPTMDVEVKTTTDRSARSVEIHGLDQLMASPEAQLMLYVIAVERVVAGGLRLADLVAGLIALGTQSTDLFDRLSAAGVGAADLGDDDVRYREVLRRAYLVGDDFPRLTFDDIATWPIRGVTRIGYSVDLSKAPPPLSIDAIESAVGRLLDRGA